jgi:hypothetical protein
LTGTHWPRFSLQSPRTSSSLWPLGFARLSIEESTGDGFLQAAHEIAEIGTFSQFGQLPNLDALFSDH